MNYSHVPCRLSVGSSSSARLSTAPLVDTAVIFVHGFNGHPDKTWLDFQGLIDRHAPRNETWQKCDLFFYGYSSVSKPIRYNARRLRAFIAELYPKPALAIFRIKIEGQDFVPEIVLRSEFTGYERLILVGHSEGSVLLRTMLRDYALEYKAAAQAKHMIEAERDTSLSTLGSLGSVDVAGAMDEQQRRLRNVAEELLHDPQWAPLDGRLRLFAPAHAGHSVTGLLGALMGMPGIHSLLSPALHWSTAHSDLAASSPLITGLRSDTDELAHTMPWLTALQAKIRWGDDEKVVYVDKFHKDTEEYAAGQNHVSVCKPTQHYMKPLEFVLEGITSYDNYATRAAI